MDIQRDGDSVDARAARPLDPTDPLEMTALAVAVLGDLALLASSVIAIQYRRAHSDRCLLFLQQGLHALYEIIWARHCLITALSRPPNALSETESGGQIPSSSWVATTASLRVRIGKPATTGK